MPALPLPVSAEVLALAFGVTTLAAALQGTVGFGFAVLSVPVLSLLDPDLAPVPQLLVTLPLTVTMAWRERHALDLRGAGWILAGRLPGAGLGLLLLKVASGRALDMVMGTIVLGAVAMLAAGREARRTPAVDTLAGCLSGVMALVSSIGGPPLALLHRGSSGARMRSTLAAIFSVGVVITLGTRVIGGEIRGSDLSLALCLLPALFLGLALSNPLRGRVDGGPLRVAILLVSTAAALALFARALRDMLPSSNMLTSLH